VFHNKAVLPSNLYTGNKDCVHVQLIFRLCDASLCLDTMASLTPMGLLNMEARLGLPATCYSIAWPVGSCVGVCPCTWINITPLTATRCP
jgi:hypothetical protein